jgi:threonine dehydratase
VENAMRVFFSDSHTLVEGAGAASLAALLKEKERMEGKCVAVVASGGNVDTGVYARVLSGR